jgi:predicted phage terminase large subunit-like protein
LNALLQKLPSLEQIKQEKARRHLIDFIQYTLPVYPNPQHQIILAEKLEAVERGEIKNLIVIMPPRHLKSETCSIRFPAWYLGRNPQKSVIACSYSDDKAYTFSHAVREIITGPKYQRLWQLQLHTAGVMHWQLEGKNDLRPSYIGAGIGGGITGEGANVLIIDDPIKNKEEAESQTVRDSIWQWYITTALTRLQNDSAKIIIMTRWHEDDLVGRLLKVAAKNPKADQWDVTHFKAIDENNKALWPEKFPLEYLEKIQAGQTDDPNEPGAGSRAFTALYQGEPSIATGNIFKREWWQYYTVRPKFKYIIHSWDTAFKTKTTSDYSALTIWGVTDSGYYLLEVLRERVELPELKRICIAAAERDHPANMLIEDAASGQSLIQELKRETRLPITPVKADKDKVVRAFAVTPLIESGRVYLPEYAPWLHDYVEELSAFPNGEHDDQVDSTTQALTKMANPSPYGFSISGEVPATDED